MQATTKNCLFFILLISLFTAGCKNKAEQLGAFKSLDATTTKIDFVNNVADRDRLNILYYLYFYNGGGVATGDINNDGLPDIYFAANNKASNKLYLNKGNFVFEDITTKAGVAGSADWCTGVTMADVNADGYLDIYVMASSNHHGLQGHNQLFINNKNNTFTEASHQYGLDFSGFGTQAAFFDYDRDGDLDCYVLNHSQKPHSNIFDTSYRRRIDTLAGDRLMRNDLATTGKFTDVSQQSGIYQSSLGYGLGISIADFNNDGWDDVYVGNDFHENDYYYLNNGNGTFTESGAKHFRHYSRFSMGNDAGDFNNDGQMDIITVDMLPDQEKFLKTYGSDENPDTYRFKLFSHGYQEQFSKNCLQRNNGNGGSFSETGLMSGVAATDWSWSPLFVDFDNDGNKDLFVSSGIVKRPVDLDYIRFVSDMVMRSENPDTKENDRSAIEKMPDGASHPYFFKGNGQLKFENVSNAWGTGNMKGYYTGAAFADFDNDGLVDVVVNSINSPALVLKNTIQNDYRKVNIIAKGADKNPFGIGAKIYLFTKGKMQYQQLFGTHGFQSSSELRLQFGVDSTKYIDSMLIVWPSQKFQLMKNIPAIENIVVEEKFAGGKFNHDSFFVQPKPLFTNVSTSIGLNWRHQENLFFDYNKQYLIPHQQSSRGPKMAVADVNGDGLDDFYLCGATGQTGTLVIQSSNQKFKIADTTTFAKYAATEEVDALFFDANKDGKQDLLVVSGGNTYLDGDTALADHLYINKGNGTFAEQTSFPKILKNKSCVVAADIDKDGDEDLFIGGLANAVKFGVPQASYLLLNDGQANYTIAPTSIANLDSLGIVTTAAFADVDNNGWPDLVVAGEWMPVKIFLNKQGKFQPTEIPHSTGMWQALNVQDANGDGYPDLLMGNWGCNSKLFAGKKSPLKLFIKDFDGNGSIEQLMAYNIDGTEFTFLAKDELERALPALKKHYLTYSEVAGKSVGFMFDDLFKDYRMLQAENLENLCYINDGKGGFSKMVLPDELQLAPIMTYANILNLQNTFVAAGNFYGVIPYEGRYDALQPTFFKFGNNRFANFANLPNIDGEARDIKWLKTSEGQNLMAVVRNNESIVFLKRNY